MNKWSVKTRLKRKEAKSKAKCHCREDLREVERLQKEKGVIEDKIHELRGRTFIHTFIGLNKPHPRPGSVGSNIY